MTICHLRFAIAVVAALTPGFAAAQHEGHQPASAQAPSADVSQCLRVQPVIENIIAATQARAEAARVSNSPSDLRAAVEHLDAALRDVRVQLGPCAAAAASADPHAGHTMPATPASSGSAPVAAPTGAVDPHAGHAASPAPAAPGTAPAAKPAAAQPEASKGTDPHAGHSAAPSGEQQRDPVNGLMVDPASAPNSTYQGQTYYFSSEQSRKEFLANPAKFARKPKG